MRPALRGALLAVGLLVTGLVSTAIPARAWQAGACAYVDTTATPPSQVCVARAGAPNLGVTCHSYAGLVQVPLSTVGAVVVVNALACA